MAFASPTDVMTITEARAAEVIPEIWKPSLQEKKFDNVTILPFVTDLSEYIVGGGDTIHVPEIFTNTFSVQTQSTEGAGIVDATKLPVDVTMTVDTHKVSVRVKVVELLETLKFYFRAISSQALA